MTIRRMTLGDVPAATPLMAELGYPTDAEAFAKRLTSVLGNESDNVLIADEQGTILGLVAVHSFEMIHRPGRLGRVTALVVAESARSRGIGSQLLRAAEKHLLEIGCVRLEVTSGEGREGAHRFYRSHGYEECRVRFIKSRE